MTIQEQLEREYFQEVYNILVTLAKADKDMAFYFIEDHITKKDPNRYNDGVCTEWRFCGVFLMGGKYRRNTNTIDYYAEHHTKELDKLQSVINEKLDEVYMKYVNKGMRLLLDTY